MWKKFTFSKNSNNKANKDRNSNGSCYFYTFCSKIEMLLHPFIKYRRRYFWSIGQKIEEEHVYR